jgi:pantoate--beta-alanine ligase
MTTAKTAGQVQEWIGSQRKRGARIGFVPTMGAIHAGHLSLVATALKTCDAVITSIFVNPTQFDDPSDLANYPVTLEADLAMLKSAGCHAVFIPFVEEVYPKTLAVPTYDFGSLERVLEGAIRPGHFRGVGQVVGRLLQIVDPDSIFMGQKDYQQYLVIRSLVHDKLNLNIEVVLCPIIREIDGLAMSSRNRRLNPGQRSDAVELSKALFWIRQQAGQRPPGVLKGLAIDRLKKVPSVKAVDYVEISDASTLEAVTTWTGPAIALGAIQMQSVRLIDNVLISI